MSNKIGKTTIAIYIVKLVSKRFNVINACLKRELTNNEKRQKTLNQCLDKTLANKAFLFHCLKKKREILSVVVVRGPSKENVSF